MYGKTPMMSVLQAGSIVSAFASCSEVPWTEAM